MARTARVPAADPLDALFEATIVELQAQLEVIATRRKALAVGGFDKELPMCAAALVRSLTSAVAERRQQSRGAAKAIEDIPIPAIVAFLKKLPVEQRKRIGHDVIGEDDDRGVFG